MKSLKSCLPALLSWYFRERVPYPWIPEPPKPVRRGRKSGEKNEERPYRIWISEVMLQQTVVSAVIPYFERWLLHFPGVRELSEADEEKVLKLWEGLGYYSRARNLRKAALRIMDEYAGSFPETYRELKALPGIGDYTARAILSLAYGKPYFVSDANVKRIGLRIGGVPEPDAEFQKLWESRLEEAVETVSPGDFNAALMQLGQKICRPGQPLCLLCPLNEICEAFAQGLQNRIPAPRSKTLKNRESRVFMIRSSQGVLLQKRKKGIAAGLWAFPVTDLEASSAWLEACPLLLENPRKHPSLIHRYTEYRDKLHPVFYETSLRRENKNPSGTEEETLRWYRENHYRWISEQELPGLPVPPVFKKLMKALNLPTGSEQVPDLPEV